MGAQSDIQWTDASWNPIRGCSRVSPGCESCYAESQAARFSRPGLPYYGFAEHTEHGPRWTRRVELVPKHLLDPIRWRRGRRIFVNSMSDLFHEGLAYDDIDRVFAVMAICAMHDRNYGHTFQILTKRAERLSKYMASPREEMRDKLSLLAGSIMQDGDVWADKVRFEMPWPLPNVWLGVSVESQKYADERIPHLLASPASVRFVSYEPALGPVDFLPFLKWTLHTTDGRRLQHPHTDIASAGGTWERGLDWVIVGGESGHSARPFRVGWARALLHASREPAAATSRVFVKQLGRQPVFTDDPRDDDVFEDYACAVGADFRPTQGDRERGVIVPLRDGHGGDMSEWPADLCVRDFPRVYGEMTQETTR